MSRSGLGHPCLFPGDAAWKEFRWIWPRCAESAPNQAGPRQGGGRGSPGVAVGGRPLVLAVGGQAGGSGAQKGRRWAGGLSDQQVQGSREVGWTDLQGQCQCWMDGEHRELGLGVRPWGAGLGLG